LAVIRCRNVIRKILDREKLFGSSAAGQNHVVALKYFLTTRYLARTQNLRLPVSASPKGTVRKKRERQKHQKANSNAALHRRTA
jgi:hypothetical protein